jgi:hypothetical protein
LCIEVRGDERPPFGAARLSLVFLSHTFWACCPRILVERYSDLEDTMGHNARVELVLDCAYPARLALFWREALDYRDYYTEANLAVLVPKEGIASPLLLQCVPEPKAGKNRMHLDIVVDDVETESLRLQQLGAHRIDEDVQSFGGTRWVRMSDPEQNEFCVSTGVEW